MASTFNLVRNSRVFFTTNVNAAGIVAASGFTTANSQELQVLDGFSFSQATNADTITLNEAGNTPVRGQRSFNTSLGNVEFSFSTYVRPYLSTTAKAEESCLWNALLCSTPIGQVLTAPTTVTTASCTTGSLSLVGTAFPVLTVGGVYIVKGVAGAGASEYNTPIKILTSTDTGLTAKYLKAPAAVAPILTDWEDVVFSSTAWNEYPVVAADTAGVVTAGAAVPYSSVSTALSNKNRLLPFGMVITVDNITYVIDDCAMDQASIDFGLDGIATIAWTGKGTKLRTLGTAATYTAVTNPVLGGGLTGTITGKTTTANFITNKLSTVTLKSNIGGASGTSYTLALTGGSISIANNITYVTPANIGVLNIPIGYFTGTRAVTGNVTAYLRTGATNTAGLLSQLMSDALAGNENGIEPKFQLAIAIGGAASGTRVEVEVDGANLQIPTVDTQAVMSTSINFTAQGYDGVLSNNAYDIESTNDLTLRYISI